MTGLFVMASGTLFRAPIVRPTAKGGQFVTGTLRVVDGSESVLVNIIAFDEVVLAELESLDQGDTLTVSGRLETSTYQKDGQTKFGLRIVADRALALKKRPHKLGKARSAAAPFGSKAAPFDDGVGDFGGRAE
jgi:single-stranded DNA-binding protein